MSGLCINCGEEWGFGHWIPPEQGPYCRTCRQLAYWHCEMETDPDPGVIRRVQEQRRRMLMAQRAQAVF